MSNKTPEGKVKEQVKALLKKYGAYYHMPVQNGMGSPTVDFIVCFKGFFIGIETKAPGKKPTERQQLTLRSIQAADGCTAVVDGGESLVLLEDLLNKLIMVSAMQGALPEGSVNE